ncbi:MAG: cell division protein FtsQ/DivIB [Thermoanaerobaculum sp.]
MTRRATRSLRTWARALVVLLAPLGAGVLGHAWQVRKVEVVGVRFFDGKAARQVLEEALGKPPMLASASVLRDRLLALPWVEDARVTVGLDGTVRCQLRERTPVAVLTDVTPPQLVDITGRLLGPAGSNAELLALSGFAAHPEERAEILGLVKDLEKAWGQPVVACERLGSREVAVSFAQDRVTVLLDPQHPEGVAAARKVLALWDEQTLGVVARLDVRVPGKVFVRTVGD